MGLKRALSVALVWFLVAAMVSSAFYFQDIPRVLDRRYPLVISELDDRTLAALIPYYYDTSTTTTSGATLYAIWPLDIEWRRSVEGFFWDLWWFDWRKEVRYYPNGTHVLRILGHKVWAPQGFRIEPLGSYGFGKNYNLYLWAFVQAVPYIEVVIHENGSGYIEHGKYLNLSAGYYIAVHQDYSSWEEHYKIEKFRRWFGTGNAIFNYFVLANRTPAEGFFTFSGRWWINLRGPFRYPALIKYDVHKYKIVGWAPRRLATVDVTEEERGRYWDPTINAVHIVYGVVKLSGKPVEGIELKLYRTFIDYAFSKWCAAFKAFYGVDCVYEYSPNVTAVKKYELPPGGFVYFFHHEPYPERFGPGGVRPVVFVIDDNKTYSNLYSEYFDIAALAYPDYSSVILKDYFGGIGKGGCGEINFKLFRLVITHEVGHIFGLSDYFWAPTPDPGFYGEFDSFPSSIGLSSIMFRPGMSFASMFGYGKKLYPGAIPYGISLTDVLGSEVTILNESPPYLSHKGNAVTALLPAVQPVSEELDSELWLRVFFSAPIEILENELYDRQALPRVCNPLTHPNVTGNYEFTNITEAMRYYKMENYALDYFFERALSTTPLYTAHAEVMKFLLNESLRVKDKANIVRAPGSWLFSFKESPAVPLLPLGYPPGFLQIPVKADKPRAVWDYGDLYVAGKVPPLFNRSADVLADPLKLFFLRIEPGTGLHSGSGMGRYVYPWKTPRASSNRLYMAEVDFTTMFFLMPQATDFFYERYPTIFWRDLKYFIPCEYPSMRYIPG